MYLLLFELHLVLPYSGVKWNEIHSYYSIRKILQSIFHCAEVCLHFPHSKKLLKFPVEICRGQSQVPICQVPPYLPKTTTPVGNQLCSLRGHGYPHQWMCLPTICELPSAE